MSEQQSLSFEAGYEELKQIVNRLEEEGVGIEERVELFARGKSIGEGLLGWLDTQEGRVEEIERSENLPQIEIVSAASAL